LLYDLNPLPRVFGYLCLGFVGSVITATIQIRRDILIVLVSASILAFSCQWDEGLPRYGVSSTRFSYQRGCLATVVWVPGSATRGTRVYHVTVARVPGSASSGATLLR
jgi:hypothetical protein